MGKSRFMKIHVGRMETNSGIMEIGAISNFQLLLVPFVGNKTSTNQKGHDNAIVNSKMGFPLLLSCLSLLLPICVCHVEPQLHFVLCSYPMLNTTSLSNFTRMLN